MNGNIITKAAKICALSAVLLMASYGCASDSQDDSPEQGGSSEDELKLRKGSVDHAAIVEVTTMMLTTGPLDFGSVLDPYNQADPFRIEPGPYREAFAKNLARFDRQDGKQDWKPNQTAMWIARVASSNYLVIDTSKPCSFDSPHTYLEIERAQMTGKRHTTCGGRMPNEDAFDVTINWLVRGPAASAEDEGALGDGVQHATKPSGKRFPYLAEMNGI